MLTRVSQDVIAGARPSSGRPAKTNMVWLGTQSGKASTSGDKYRAASTSSGDKIIQGLIGVLLTGIMTYMVTLR